MSLRSIFLPKARVASRPAPVHPVTKVLGLGVAADVLGGEYPSRLDQAAFVAVPLVIEQVVKAGARKGAREQLGYNVGDTSPVPATIDVREVR